MIKYSIIILLICYSAAAHAAYPILGKNTNSGAWGKDTVAVTSATVSASGYLDVRGINSATPLTVAGSVPEDTATTATYAITSGSADSATTATHAGNADTATTATYALNAASGVTALQNLTDVLLDDLATSQSLTWNGSVWVNRLVVGEKGDKGDAGEDLTPLPALSGNAGKVLTVSDDETTASWKTVSSSVSGGGLTTVTLVERALEADAATTATYAILAATAQYATTATQAVKATSADTAVTATIAPGYGKLSAVNAWTGTNDFTTTPTVNGVYLGTGSSGSSSASSSVYYTSGTLASGGTVTVTHASDPGPGFKRRAQLFSGTLLSSEALLCHFDGTSGSTTFTDVTGKTLTAATYDSGTPSINTSTYKYGTGSCYFPSLTYLSIPHSTAFEWGTGNFTIEAWVYTTTWGNGIFSLTQASDASVNYGYFYINSSGYLGFVGGGSLIYTSTATVPTSTWTHVAITRASGTLYFFIGGVLCGTSTCTDSLTYSNTSGIGANPGNGCYKPIYIDDLHVLKGNAKYTASYTVPSAAVDANYYWSPVPYLWSSSSSANTYVGIKYTDSSNDNPSTNTTFTNNTGASMKYLATVQILP